MNEHGLSKEAMELLLETGAEKQELLDAFHTPEVVYFENAPYVRKGKDVSPLLEPTPAPVHAATLTAVVDYLNRNPDDLDLAALLIHVRGPRDVEVVSSLAGPFRQRHVYLKASPATPSFAFDRNLDPEQFVIGLQTCFADDEHRAMVLRCVGNLNKEESARVQDDGVTQTVSMRKGINRKDWEELPSPIVLRPFRTFPEVEQPESAFILRVDNEMRPALLEADGGAWKLKAMQHIAEYLRGRVPEAVHPLT